MEEKEVDPDIFLFFKCNNIRLILDVFRDEKIERERREKELKDMAECSFAPTISRDLENNNNPRGTTTINNSNNSNSQVTNKNKEKDLR